MSCSSTLLAPHIGWRPRWAHSDRGIPFVHTPLTDAHRHRQVIEMTQVTAASDIWSVGCLIVEVLNGSPPYFELQPMSALFRIVQDSHPPLPSKISPLMEDFLLLCFQKARANSSLNAEIALSTLAERS